MSTAAVSSNLVAQQSPGYFQQRRADLQQLSQDLQSGNLSAAQQDFSSIQSLAQTGPFASSGDAFKTSQRQQDFTQIGQALQSGNLAGAQQAFSQLQSTFQHRAHLDPPPPVANSSTGAAGGSGSQVVLNLGNLTPGEQITIGVNNSSSGGEQVTIGVANQGQTPEQVTLNLNKNSNQEIILNLFNSTASNSTPGTGSSGQSNGVSVSA